MNEVGLKRLRIFTASPSDMANERVKVDSVVGALKPLADHLDIVVDVIDWRTIVPNAGRAEQVILDQLKPDTWGAFIGILWHRFGTPTGEKDAQTGKAYFSGTEEEFYTAYRLWKQHGKPRIMMYRCVRSFPFNVDPDQLKRVNEFFGLIEDPKSDFRVLTQKFDTVEAFEKMLLDHLQKFLLEYGEAIRGKPIAPEIVQELVLPRIPNTLPRRTPFFGRKEEIAEAMRALSPEDRGWGVVIDGIGGIGKTALAIEVAYLCKEQNKFNAFIFVSAKRNRLEPSGIQNVDLAATTLDTFVNEIARAIGQHKIVELAENQKRHALLNALQEMKSLLILDNLETLTNVEQNGIGDFLRYLPNECKAIVTSRRRTGESAVTIRLKELEWDDARQIIESEMTRHPDTKRALANAGETGWRELYEETGGSPLALTWIIGLIRSRGLSFKKALVFLRNGGKENELVEFIFNQAQDRLDTNERTVLRALSFFDGPAPYPVLLETTKLNRRALDIALERLKALSLVNTVADREDEIERFTLHLLTRQFAKSNLEKHSRIEQEMGMRFARFWVRYAEAWGGRYAYETWNRLNDEWSNLAEAGRWLWKAASVTRDNVGNPEALRMLDVLTRRVSRFLDHGVNRYEESIQLSTWVYEGMCVMKDWSAAGEHAYEISKIYGGRDRNSDSLVWIDRSLTAFDLGGSEDQRATAAERRAALVRKKATLK